MDCEAGPRWLGRGSNIAADPGLSHCLAGVRSGETEMAIEALGRKRGAEALRGEHVRALYREGTARDLFRAV